MTGSVEFNTVAFDQDGGGIFLIASGSALTGTMSSSAVSQVYAISMSSNVDSKHTPPNATASYFTVSASNSGTGISSNRSYLLYYYNTGSQSRTRIQVGPNSSSLTSSYGSLSGGTFHISSSVGYDSSYNEVNHFYYSIPDVLTRASSSAITITSFSGSQSSIGQDQYQFHISGSGGHIYKFIPTGSEYIPDYSKRVESLSGSFLPFQFFHSGSTGSAGQPISGSTISEGIQSLTDTVNAYSSSIGVTATSSATTVQFNALNAGVDTVFSFATQSLLHHATSSQFVFSIGTHISSSVPDPGAASGSVYEIPLDVSASALNVATASVNVLNTVSQLSASISASGADLYGIVITNTGFASHGEITGSSTPAFEYTILQSGSYPPVRPTDYEVPADRHLEIYVPPEASRATMISESIEQINLYMQNENPAFLNANYVPQDTGDPSGSTFFLASAPGKINSGVNNDINVTYARGISASIVASGSGEVDSPNEIPGAIDVANARGSFNIDPNDLNSVVVSGSNTLYISSSGRIGLGTTDPSSDIDLRANEFQVRAKESVKGVRVNKEGNIESFSADAAAATTGSEFILNYSRGTSVNAETINKLFGAETVEDDSAATTFFNALSAEEQASVLEKATRFGLLASAQAGDVLGSIRWIAESGSSDFGKSSDEVSRDSRVQGEAARIEADVNTSDDTGITADMIFKLAVLPQLAPQQVLRLDAGASHELTGSLGITANITLGNDLSLADNSKIISTNENNTYILLNNDDYWRINANNVDTARFTSGGTVFNEGAAPSANFRVETANDDHALYIDGGADTIELGRAATTHVTASGNISASGHISASGGTGAGYVVRPNLYFFATNTSAIIMNGGSDFGSGATDNQGSLPETNTTTVTLSQEQNSHTNVFSLSSNRITIARAGLYKLTYNATLEISNGSNRIEGFVGLVQETSGGTVTLIDGSEGRGYHRFVHSTRPSSQTYAASVIVNVAADSIYDLRFGIIKQSIATQKLRTLATGTSILIEAIT